ncbi:MAG: CHAT domain-containing protein [Cyanobacteria bacterium J06635_10]
MARNWLRITHQDDNIQLSWQRGLSAPRSAPPVLFEHPFDEETLKDLRWYLEQFLDFPYGIFLDKAKKIEQKFQEWGEQLFKLVFPRTTKAWDFFQEATREGLDNCEINISSDDPTVLNLPWELLYSPDYQFLAPSLAGMYRSLSGHAVRAEMGQLSQDKLNILLVIARPYGEKDVAFKTIARPMLEALKPIQKYINLKVLRPPSFEQFERELNAHKGFYHIVHFDGHGNFDADSAGFQHSFGSKGQGVLVFENIDGSPQIVIAAQIAQSLNDCRVPIFVLNACKSAQEGEGSFSSVATRLVSLGAKSVVAMAYNVQVEAAKHFIGRFYQQLVVGTDVSNAVAAARRQVVNQRLRPSSTSKGDLPLADWMVPVLYQQETYTPFVPANNTTEDILDIDNFLEETVSNLVGFPEQGRYGFIGRDYDILGLERAFRQNNIVLLQGMGGVGKTELTVGFARWLEETQGRCSEKAATRSHFFFISFESGASLSRVVNEVGRAIWGDKFFQYAAEQQQKAVLNYLKQKSCLLIWDNFEPVAGFPHGNEPLLSEHERNDLKQFLKELRGGETWVLITSRREEVWLDCGYSLVNLQGLSPIDTQEFAAKILQTVGVEMKNLSEEYLDLLKLVGEHPLSLRVVLPHLHTQTPMQVIEALRQGLDSLEKKPEVERERDKSLVASLDYSFSRLSEKAKKHLPFLGLFCKIVNVHTLSNFSQEFGFDNLVGFGKTYQSIFGTYFEIKDWQEILNETAKAGILEDIGEGIFRLYPTLPWYLRQKFSQNYNADVVSQLENKLLIFYLIIAVAHDIQDLGYAEKAITILMLEEPNLLQYFRLALSKNDWNTASGILKSLGQVYDILGLSLEYRSLRERSFHKIGINLVDVKTQDESAFKFWTYLKSADALEALRQGNLENARLTHLQIINEYK